jgi:hypothetical protein
MLFALGILALIDYTLTGGEVFTPVNSIMFLIMSFAVLLRLRNSTDERTIQKLLRENDELKAQIHQQAHSQIRRGEYEETIV